MGIEQERVYWRMYAIADTGVVYQQGQGLASLEQDARTAGQALVDALEGVTLGSQHGAATFQGQIDEYQTDCADARNSLADAVSTLGENTSSGARAAEETNNDGTNVANQNTALARSINVRRPTVA